jgi:hypothetical protein
MRDDHLRDQLAGWARTADRLPVPGLRVLRARVRRRRIRAAVAVAVLAAAGAAAGLAIALLPAAPGQAGGVLTHDRQQPRHRGGIPVAWYPAGPQLPADASAAAAPYFVTIRFQQAPAAAQVIDWRTGQVVATVSPPAASGSASGSGGFQAVAAAADGRTFVLAAPAASGSTDMVLYELRLAAGGRPLPLTRLPVAPLRLSAPTSFAISPDGSELAVSIVRARPTIAVISRSSRRSRVWTTEATGSVGGVLNWAGDSYLAFSWTAAFSPGASQQGPANQEGSGLRYLDVRASGHDLLSSRLVVPDSASFGGFSQGAFPDPLVSADGSAVFLTLVKGADVNPQAEVVQFSASTGRPVRAVLPPAGESGIGSWCGALWSDPSGSQLAAACAVDDQGTVSDGRLTERDLHVPSYEESMSRPAFVAW